MFKKLLGKIPYAKWSDMDKLVLQRQLLIDQYGENIRVMQRAAKIEKRSETPSFPQLLNRVYPVGEVPDKPVTRL